MAPPILKLDHISLSFGGTPLLDEADLQVGPGDRICLVGRNGSGKSTLLKIAAGLVEPQSGDIFRHPSATVRYLPQAPDFGGHESVRAYAEAGLAPGDEAHRVSYLLEHLGLDGTEDPARLSGGEARRAALARVMAPDPDILLLDEPTNHLDLPAIEWLEEEIRRMKGAVLVISHDRRFLARVSRATVWLDRGKARRIEKDFSHFEAWRDEVLEAEAEEQHKLGRQIEREEHWLRYGVTARRKRNVRRLGQLQALRKSHREHDGPQGRVAATLSKGRESGKLVIEAEGISKRFGGQAVVDDFSIRIHRGDCIGLVGPNGAGKTTLIKMLTGELPPDEGLVRLGTNLEIARLDQQRAALDPDETLSHFLTDGRGDTLIVNGAQKHVTGYMKEFLFAPEQAGTPIRNLSGGEKARLILARILARPSNLLILDEPTNDLDIETLDLLEEIVTNYSGTVLLVSHDRDFLDRTVSTTLAPATPTAPNGHWIAYAGGYSDMRAQRRDAENSDRRAAGKASKDTGTKKTDGVRKPAQAVRKLSYKQKYALETLPERMEAATATIKDIEARMADPALFARDPERFSSLATRLAEQKTALEAMESEWLELEMLREEIEG
ncbi:ABC-F family ATP-binding cassette domain-containing protein [Pseudohoeflea coraliihabitans]|uniref:ATP-binding cassette domain-containing protein n=1 Tax=Pseudohoeflea coraliihabitans TaxID=2860393 RepID=A0ABS6WKU7_9HYPH|nr:ATP-binding cassette domain-containing protein [Pseudohoeflea sp. DP4N28-3]MBW3096571.1 ATP-binding cassette domain-containing protein [Pseudohoeflea sp. DP4N28-3]